ncbi:MAG: hypothetical protein ACJZ78_05390 [Prochlorococcus marinus]
MISVSWRSTNSQALEITSSLEDLGVMFICLKNALMPSENQQVLRLRLDYFMPFQVPRNKTARFLISLLLIIFCWFIVTPRLFLLSHTMVASPLYSWVLLLAYFFLLFPIGAVIYIWTRKMTLRKALKGDLRKLSKEDLRDVLKDVLKN